MLVKPIKQLSTFQRLVAARTGGATERCHGIRHSGSYPVSAHTWNVLVLLWLLWPEDFGRLSVPVMFHDVPEAWVGDIPAPTKRYNPAIKEACAEMEARIMRRLQLPWDEELPPEDRAKVKTCDLMELYMWAAEQVHGGNRHASCVVREVQRYFEEVPPAHGAVDLWDDMRRGNVEHATDRLVMEINHD